jgi:hypothetical protein
MALVVTVVPSEPSGYAYYLHYNDGTVGFEDMAMVNDEAQLHEIDWVSIQGPFQSGTMVNV